MIMLMLFCMLGTSISGPAGESFCDVCGNYLQPSLRLHLHGFSSIAAHQQCSSCIVPVNIPLGAESSRGAQTLSDLDHHSEDGEHNVKFDHEAFLGKEQAETFSELSPAEAKRRLG